MNNWRNRVFCEDAVDGLARLPDGVVDLIIADPPYNLGKDYGNDSDQQSVEDYLAWTEDWITKALPKLKPNGSLYIFLTWRFSPEIFVMLKKRMTMMNEIIWDRRVLSPRSRKPSRKTASPRDWRGRRSAAKSCSSRPAPSRARASCG